MFHFLHRVRRVNHPLNPCTAIGLRISHLLWLKLFRVFMGQISSGWSTILDCSNNWHWRAVRLSWTTLSENPIVHFHPFGTSILDPNLFYWKVSLFWTSFALLNFIKFEKSGTEQTKRPQRMQSWRPEGIFWIQFFYLKPFPVTSNEMFDNTRQVITVYIL